MKDPPPAPLLCVCETEPLPVLAEEGERVSVGSVEDVMVGEVVLDASGVGRGEKEAEVHGVGEPLGVGLDVVRDEGVPLCSTDGVREGERRADAVAEAREDLEAVASAGEGVTVGVVRAVGVSARPVGVALALAVRAGERLAEPLPVSAAVGVAEAHALTLGVSVSGLVALIVPVEDLLGERENVGVTVGEPLALAQAVAVRECVAREEREVLPLALVQGLPVRVAPRGDGVGVSVPPLGVAVCSTPVLLPVMLVDAEAVRVAESIGVRVALEQALTLRVCPCLAWEGVSVPVVEGVDEVEGEGVGVPLLVPPPAPRAPTREGDDVAVPVPHTLELAVPVKSVEGKELGERVGAGCVPLPLGEGGKDATPLAVKVPVSVRLVLALAGREGEVLRETHCVGLCVRVTAAVANAEGEGVGGGEGLRNLLRESAGLKDGRAEAVLVDAAEPVSVPAGEGVAPMEALGLPESVRGCVEEATGVAQAEGRALALPLPPIKVAEGVP